MFLLNVYFQDWIGNRNKTVNCQKYNYPKAIYSRGMSSFNCYVHVKKGRKLIVHFSPKAKCKNHRHPTGVINETITTLMNAYISTTF